MLLTAHSADDYRWLTGPEGAAWLARAAVFDGSTAAQTRRLRAALSPAQASLVLAQLDLRRRAREKFSAADKMYFTARGLEQASDEHVAGYKARRFKAGSRAIDVCAGIGGDLAALARRGPTVGIDREEVLSILAAANARAQLDSAATVETRTSDAAAVDVGACDAWHIDPDRRPRGRRTTQAELHDPPAATIDRLLAANPHAAVKLAPAAGVGKRWSDLAELEWISRARSCRQLVAWFGDLAAHPGRRRATVLGAAGQPLATLVGSPCIEVPVADRIARYLFEPDAAVLAAELTGALAERHDLGAVSPGIAYWTGEATVADALVSAFEVEEVLPLDMKRVKSLLRARHIGRLEIKVRGVELDPAELRRRLRPAGEAAATLLVTRIAKRVTAILARRLEPSPLVGEGGPGAPGQGEGTRLRRIE
jgi:hypothetical protein